MTEVALLLPPPSHEMLYLGGRSVAPASLNALTDSDGHDGFNSASNGQPSPRHDYADSPLIFERGALRFGITKASRGVMDAAIQALIEKAVCEALERAAHRLETLGGNLPYEKAWKRGAKEIRALKPL